MVRNWVQLLWKAGDLKKWEKRLLEYTGNIENKKPEI